MSRTTRLALRIVAAEPDEATWRQQMFQRYVGEMTKLATEFGRPGFHPDYIRHLQKQFMTMSVPEIQKYMDDLPNELRMRRMNYEADVMKVKWEEEEREKTVLRTARDKYELADDTYERVVCSNGSPGFEKTGMPAFAGDVAEYDQELKGYFGVHVGSARAWLPVLARDGYCDDDAYIYDIHAEEIAHTKKPLYIMEDYHVMDRGASPGSDIIFSRRKVLPAEIIELKKVIPADQIEPAPDLY
jgi:hypothetical protein